MRLAVAIPAYQAAPFVGSVVDAPWRVVRDVLVVDDGSRDGTARAARATGAEVHVLPNNRGKGAALRTAFDILFSTASPAWSPSTPTASTCPRRSPGCSRPPATPTWCWAPATICSAR